MRSIAVGRPCFTLLLCYLGLILCGCGSSNSGPKKYRVSGNVTFQNKPVPAGWVIFEPDAEKGTTGPAGIGQIKNGRYATESGKGVVGGSYIVRVAGHTGIPAEQDGISMPLGTLIFPEYRLNMDFPEAASTHDFTVPDESASP